MTSAKDNAMRRLLTILISLLVLAGCQSASDTPEATLILMGGHVITPEQTGATALAISDGRIVMVGNDNSINNLKGPDTKVGT